jgi:hypothetical protein
MTFVEAIPIVEVGLRPWLDAVIERVEIAPAIKLGRGFDPGRVEIVWR